MFDIGGYKKKNSNYKIQTNKKNINLINSLFYKGYCIRPPQPDIWVN